MTCIILAAGMAKRLRPLTDTTPKCLLEVAGRTLLGRSMDALISRGCRDFVIVTGYLKNQIESFVTREYGSSITVRFICNDIYESTNNIYSLYLACQEVCGEALLLDSDLLYNPRLLDEVLASKEENIITLARHELGEEEMKICVDEFGTVSEISKTCSPSTSAGESLGIEKMGAAYLTALTRELDEMMRDEGARQLFYERAFERLIQKGHSFKILDVTRFCGMEIDTVEDYEKANRLYGDEVICGHLVTKEVKCVWARLLEMLQVVLQICERHNIRVFADGGTLLGAARHKGFIPWDNDIDLGIPRRDYDKLLAILPHELPEGMYLQTSENDPEYHVGHAKIRCANSAAISIKDVTNHNHYHMGLFLDLFPYDGVPETEEEQKEVAEEAKKLRTIIEVCAKRRLTSWRSIPGKIYCKILYKFLGGAKGIFKRREDLYRKNDFDSSARWEVAPGEFGWLPSQCFPRHYCDRVVMLPFEHVMIPCPADYERLLTDWIGDWHKFVKGGSGHEDFILLGDVPFEKILKERFGYSDDEIVACRRLEKGAI